MYLNLLVWLALVVFNGQWIRDGGECISMIINLTLSSQSQ